MSEIVYFNKDITKNTFGIIAVVCNCQGSMHKGLINQFRKKYPIIQEACQNEIRYKSLNELLGEILPIKINNSFYIVLMFAQSANEPNKINTNVKALESALNKSLEFCTYKNLPLLIPKIGCGLNGLSWSLTVEPIIKKLFLDFDIPIEVYSI